jgi:hypothetical protein
MSRERELLKEVSWQLEAFIDGGYWPNTHILLDDINKELAKPEPEPLERKEILKIYRESKVDFASMNDCLRIARAIERAHGIE